MKLRSWGADFQEVNDCIKAFKKYDENEGGTMLFDEFIAYADDQILDIEKDAMILKNLKNPKKIYKKQEFLKAGSRRPNLIDPDIWTYDDKDFVAKDI